MDLFKIVPDNFFSLLSSKNKEIYLGCIFEAFKVYEDGSILGLEKKIVVEVLTDYLAKNEFESDEWDPEEVQTVRDKANFVLRRMEDCGWIDIDVANDYTEILNFRDYAITIIEALLDIQPNAYDTTFESNNEYKGYIFTIYSLLSNEKNVDYSVLMEQVYRNTKLFIRELRKLDSRLKDYIRKLVDKTDIKDLMASLVDYNVELVDKAYYRLKTSDNINKYRLFIVNKLESFANSNEIMNQICLPYKNRYSDEDEAYRICNRDISDIIDVFNSLDDIITQIDLKNKTYINTTIAKIQFLLKDDENIPGKIAVILKYVAQKRKEGKGETANNMLQPIFNLRTYKELAEQSLYQPRTRNVKIEPQHILLDREDFSDLQDSFFKEHKDKYTQAIILQWVDAHLVNGMVKASELIENDEIESLLKVIYALIYTSSEDDGLYVIDKLTDIANCGAYEFYDFIIKKEIKEEK